MLWCMELLTLIVVGSDAYGDHGFEVTKNYGDKITGSLPRARRNQKAQGPSLSSAHNHDQISAPAAMADWQ